MSKYDCYPEHIEGLEKEFKFMSDFESMKKRAPVTEPLFLSVAWVA